MYKRFTAFAILYWLSGGFSAYSQMMEKIVESFQSKPKLAFKLDARNSFITSRPSRMKGFKLALDYNRTVEVGVGYNWLSSSFEQELLSSDTSRLTSTYSMRMHYAVVYMSYTFYSSTKWQLSIPVQIGFGRSFYNLNMSEVSLYDRQAEGSIIVYEPGMTAEYKLVRYIGLGTGIGLRIMLMNNRSISEQFTAPVYILKFKIHAGELYRDIFQNK